MLANDGKVTVSQGYELYFEAIKLKKFLGIDSCSPIRSLEMAVNAFSRAANLLEDEIRMEESGRAMGDGIIVGKNTLHLLRHALYRCYSFISIYGIRLEWPGIMLEQQATQLCDMAVRNLLRARESMDNCQYHH